MNIEDMKINLILSLVISCYFLTGCAQMFPAHATKLDTGGYMIQTTSNIFGSNESMVNKVNKKAETICEGKGFSEGNNNFQNHSQQIYLPQIVTTGSYKTFNKVIKCN